MNTVLRVTIQASYALCHTLVYAQEQPQYSLNYDNGSYKDSPKKIKKSASF